MGHDENCRITEFEFKEVRERGAGYRKRKRKREEKLWLFLDALICRSAHERRPLVHSVYLIYCVVI